MGKESLFEENMPLVRYVLKRFGIMPSYEMYEDYLQIGYIGLFKAVEKFNPELGFLFSTYAVPVIEGEIRRDMRDNTYIHVSRRLKDIYCKHRSLSEKGYTDTEICKKLEIEESALVEALIAMQPVAHLDERLNEDSETTYSECLTDGRNPQEERLTAMITSEKFKLFRMHLNDREEKILDLRLEGKSQRDIAKEIGRSQVQVSRSLVKITEMLSKLNKKYESGAIKVYEKQIDAIKNWLINNPGMPIKINHVLRAKGLEILNGYQSQWKRRAFKELQKEGHNVELRGAELIYICECETDDQPAVEVDREPAKCEPEPEMKLQKDDQMKARSAGEPPRAKPFLVIEEVVDVEALNKMGMMISAIADYPTSSKLIVKIFVAKV